MNFCCFLFAHVLCCYYLVSLSLSNSLDFLIGVYSSALHSLYVIISVRASCASSSAEKHTIASLLHSFLHQSASWGEGASLALVGNPFSDGVTIKIPYPLRLSNTGLVSSGDILTSWGEGSTLALVGHPSSDGIMIKMSYGVDVLHQPALHLIFSYWVG